MSKKTKTRYMKSTTKKGGGKEGDEEELEHTHVYENQGIRITLEMSGLCRMASGEKDLA